MDKTIDGRAIVDAMTRACRAVESQTEYLTSLDQAVGDGDLGITLGKIAVALAAYSDTVEVSDVGRFLSGAGLAATRAGSSTMGTLLATALMRAGKAVAGQSEVSAADLVEMFRAADAGVRERGKAKAGDKTVLDALSPACEAFAAAIVQGASLADAGNQALKAAQEGRDSVTPLRSRIGRASWVGERTEGQVDPGCAAFVILLKAIVSQE